MVYLGVVIVYIVLAVTGTKLAKRACDKKITSVPYTVYQDGKIQTYYRHSDEDEMWIVAAVLSTIGFFALLGGIQLYRYNIDEQYVLSEWHVEGSIKFAQGNPEVENRLRSYLADKKLTNKEWYALRKFEKELKLDNFIYGEN